LLHVVVVVIAFFGLPSLFSPAPVSEQPVVVELVAFEPEAKVKPAKPEPPKAIPPPKPARVIPPPPPPLAALPEPAPAPKAKPEPKPKPKPKRKAEPKPKPKPKAKPKAKPKPKPKPRVAKRVPRPKAKPKPPPDRFQALLKNLAKQSKKQRKAEKSPKKPARKKVQVAAAPRPAVVDRRVAAGLAQLVEQQIRECWNIPGGAKGVQEMHIEIRIRLNPDGTLHGMPAVGDARRMKSDPVFRTVAESALRALRNPRCSPLKLPYAEYDIWKDITLNFDPREALGQ
jgi:outer membrane biosynthesis protein TonB